LSCDEAELASLGKRPNGSFLGRFDCMPEDDDIDYTVTSLGLLTQHGYGFVPADVANFWLSNIPILHTCTAERVAYRNVACGFESPVSATYQNPYREWIGAQIRADLYGWAAPGDLDLARDMAWRDASISHVANGIYGAMFSAAMNSTAMSSDRNYSLENAGRYAATWGLKAVPPSSRLSEQVGAELGWYEESALRPDPFELVHADYDEAHPHDWCHTISNARIVAAALVAGRGDFARSVCLAVSAGFDTDCNGATVGAVLGAALGASGIPREWSEPLGGKIRTGVIGYETVEIDWAVEKLASIVESRPSL
jgi:hypothetical protein